MKISDSHLSWCLNIYPGESWEATRNNIFKNAPKVAAHLKQKGYGEKLSNGLGLGLRLADEAVNTIHKNVTQFKQDLGKENLYAFTVNAFPFGNFHTKPVKQYVYFPDWGSKERLDYTCKTADILAELLPADQTYGSISTVPVTYGKVLPETAIENLMAFAKHCEIIEQETGKIIQLALEPEPDCYLERTDEAIAFFKLLTQKDSELTKKYLGICLDTCHMALQFESPLESLEKLIDEKISIPKIQISSVLSFDRTNFSLDSISKYNEAVYLHQTLIKDENETIHQFPDLGDAVKADIQGEWRIHFHVPLYFSGNNTGISSTSYLLDKAFMTKAFEACRHLETETYTFNVLPDAIKDVNESIAKEFEFVLNQLS
jgi:hypothetical protein